MAGGTGVAMATTDCRRCESNKRCAYCFAVAFSNAVFVQDGKSVDQLRLEALVLLSTVSDAHCHIIATGAKITPCSTQLIEQCGVFSARMEGYTGSLNRGGPTSKSSCLPEHARRF